jgi:hypothetical protein
MVLVAGEEDQRTNVGESGWSWLALRFEEWGVDAGVVWALRTLDIGFRLAVLCSLGDC